MSVEYNAAIVVGADWRDINEEDAEKIDDLICCGDLHDFPPFYDGCREGLFGLYIVNSPDYSYCEVEYTVQDIDAAKQKFKELTGMEGKVYLTTIGS